MIIESASQSALRAYTRSRLVRFGLLFSFLLNVSIWLVLAWASQRLPDLMPLHYNIYFGIDQIGSWYQIFAMPLYGLVVLAINFFLGFVLFRFEKMISYVLIGGAFAIQILILMASISVLYINS